MKIIKRFNEYYTFILTRILVIAVLTFSTHLLYDFIAGSFQQHSYRERVIFDLPKDIRIASYLEWSKMLDSGKKIIDAPNALMDCLPNESKVIAPYWTESYGPNWRIDCIGKFNEGVLLKSSLNNGSMLPELPKFIFLQHIEWDKTEYKGKGEFVRLGTGTGPSFEFWGFVFLLLVVLSTFIFSVLSFLLLKRLDEKLSNWLYKVEIA